MDLTLFYLLLIILFFVIAQLFLKNKKSQAPHNAKLSIETLTSMIDSFLQVENNKTSHLLLKKDERLIFDIQNTSLLEEHNVKRKLKHQGFSVRLMKGVSYRFGGGEIHSVKEIEKIDEGDLILTNKRLFFSGSSFANEIHLSKINTIQAVENGVQITRSNKRKAEYYCYKNQPVIRISEEGKEAEEFELDGIAIKIIIEKIINNRNAPT